MKKVFRKIGLVFSTIVVVIFMTFPVFADNFQEGMNALKQGNFTEAVKILEPQASKGNARAQFRLGLIYFEGKLDEEPDFEEAFQWFRRSAKQGYVRAQVYLGSMYENGTGIIQDYQKAVKWYKLAIEKDDDEGQFLLRIFLRRSSGISYQQIKEIL